MPKSKVTFDTVRKIAQTLPGTEDVTAYGSPAINVRGTLMAWIALNKAAEPNSLMIRIDFDQRDAMIEDAPKSTTSKITTPPTRQSWSACPTSRKQNSATS